MHEDNVAQFISHDYINITELTHEQTVKFDLKHYYALCVLCL